MTPNAPSSFWNQHLEPLVQNSAAATPNALVNAVKDLYRVWCKKFQHSSDLYVHHKRAYFIGEGILKATAGIIQIKDYAKENNDLELLTSHQTMCDCLKRTREEFFNLLVDKNGINYFGQATTTETQQQPTAVTKFDKVLEKRLALAGALVSELGEDKHFGRTKLAKVFYLADVSQGLNLNTDYYREAAGPLDPRALYNEKIGIEALAAKRGYFLSTGVGRFVRYTPANNLPALLQQVPELFGRKWKGVTHIIALCRSLSTDQCEIITTLYACWNDLLLDGADVTDEMIIREFLTNWHEKKRRFPKQRLINALEWMRSHHLAPEGRGKHTQAKLPV